MIDRARPPARRWGSTPLSIQDSVIIKQLPTGVRGLHSKALRLYDGTKTGLVVGDNLHDYRDITGVAQCCQRTEARALQE